jgi:hypothetical protein
VGTCGKLPLGDLMENNDETDGVLRLKLEQKAYEWRFVPVTSESFIDSGSAGCH